MKPRIALLATGGTIAGAAEAPTAAHYRSAAIPAQELLAAIPKVTELAAVECEQFAQVGSQQMDDALWLRLAARVNALLVAGGVDGVVITHGTDTLEETGYFLNLVVKSEAPVILTAAMRPATALSADGPLNLYNAVAVAAHPASRGKGVLVVVDDEIHSAREIVKTNTTELDSFSSPNTGRVGIVTYGAARFFHAPVRAHTAQAPFRVDGLERLPRVDVLFAHAGMEPDLVDAVVGLGAKGLVIAGVGNGNVSDRILAALDRARAHGVVVVRSSRAGSGIVGRNVELDDDAHGFVAADELGPAKARVLLKLALNHTTDLAEIQRCFCTY
ncbi:MAG: asparaginase [Planctomycetes bacterium]|nr:asparaginase [Planctomycetota bacterium]